MLRWLRQVQPGSTSDLELRRALGTTLDICLAVEPVLEAKREVMD